MTVFKEDIEKLLPEFEAAVYDPLVETMFGEIDDSAELESARTLVSVMNHCRETSEAGHEFFKRRLGHISVRLEVHVQPDEHHHFLSIPEPESNQLSPEDLIIDPTYLQYLRNRRDQAALKGHQRVFIGTRAAIMQLMEGSDFLGPEAAILYSPDTLKTTA